MSLTSVFAGKQTWCSTKAAVVLRWDQKRQNTLMTRLKEPRCYSPFRFSLRFPSLITLLLIESLPCSWCWPDTTTLLVWELSITVKQESISKAVRLKCAASYFIQQEDDWPWRPQQGEIRLSTAVSLYRIYFRWIITTEVLNLHLSSSLYNIMCSSQSSKKEWGWSS